MGESSNGGVKAMLTKTVGPLFPSALAMVGIILI